MDPVCVCVYFSYLLGPIFLVCFCSSLNKKENLSSVCGEGLIFLSYPTLQNIFDL